jgi:hypothetical protein
MENKRRSFLKKSAIAGIGLGTYPSLLRAAKVTSIGTLAADNEGIAIWGHSYPADITPERLAAGLRTVNAARPERPIVNQSFGGLGLDQSLMRMGAYEWTVEVAGGMIPARGRVELINPRSQTMAKQFDSGLVPIVAKYPTVSRVFLNADKEVWLEPVPNKGEEFVDTIFKNIRMPQSQGIKSTWASIRGVVGQIGPDDPKGPIYFLRREEGEVIRVDGPAEVKMLAVGPEMQHDVTTLNRWLNIVWTPGVLKMRWPEIYGPSEQKQLECEASFEIQKLRMSIFVQSVLQCMRASDKRLILLTDSWATAPPSDNLGNQSAVLAQDLRRQFYREHFPNYYFDFKTAALNGLKPVPPAREWFAKTHPELFRDPDWGWGAELHAIPNGRYMGGNHTGKEKAAVAELRLTGNGGCGVKAAARVVTKTPGATRWVKTGLFVGVQARKGVAVRLTVREGGRGYAVGDLITIPADAVGNAAPITGEVTAIREETIGTVRHPDGKVDVAHSYSQWDVDNGNWPRCFRRDVGHFSVPGAEYLSQLLAARIKELGW